jgi:hypothetical protein
MIDAYKGLRSSYDFGMLQIQTPSFAVTFSSRDRTVVVFFKLGFLDMRPVFYFDVKDYLVLNRNNRPKPEIDENALKEAVIKKASQHFDTFYIRTDEREDFIVTSPLETMGVKEEHRLVCLALERKIIPFEEYFESEGIG